jgi:hypothetical protein
MSRSFVRVAVLASALVAPFGLGCSVPAEGGAENAEPVEATSQALCTDPHTPSWVEDLPEVNHIAVSQGTPGSGVYGNPCSNYFVTEIDRTTQRTFGLEIELSPFASVNDATACTQSYVVSYVDGYRPATFSFFTQTFYPAAWDRLRDVALTHATWTGTRCVIRQAFNLTAGAHTQVNVSAGVWGPTGALPVEVIAHGGPLTLGY